ncbi:hypothetical protein CPB84DRAFT_1752297 [Gymnopilus junonius]|uniref:Uncharacterized protein n=1 Tax=Gymnopilus junonius TaxID=109634 RepID=A0A9P5N9P5_GYMJU|nr:hypothetical protein CPB84DRAFT_1752297 [Gymnopilus junonius]
MPICFCKTAGCLDHGGIDRVSGEPKGCKVDYRTYEKHAMYEDRARRFEDAQKCTPEGDDYSDETLPDNDTLHEHSGTSTCKSQTVRSQRDCKQKKARSPSPHASPRPTTQEVRIVSLLSILRDKVDKFGKEVSSQLDRLEPPSFSGPPPPFPLISSFEELQSFKDRLHSITLRGQNSVTLQQDISKTLHLIEESLEGGEKQWNQELEKIRKEQSPQQGIAFDTG